MKIKIFKSLRIQLNPKSSNIDKMQFSQRAHSDGTDSPYETGEKFADNYSLTRTRPGPARSEA